MGAISAQLVTTGLDMTETMDYFRMSQGINRHVRQVKERQGNCYGAVRRGPEENRIFWDSFLKKQPFKPKL